MTASSSQVSESNKNEFAQLSRARWDKLEEKLAEAEDKLNTHTCLQVTISQLNMELEEAQARIQVIDEQL